MIDALREFFSRRELLYMLTWRDIHVRYKQSVMGLLWAVLMPALVVGAGVLIRVLMAHFTGTPVSTSDVMSVLVRGVAWAFFVTAVRFGTISLTANGPLVTKIAFPKEVFPVASVLSSLFDYFVALATSVIILLVLGWKPTLMVLWVVPLLLELIALTTGLCLILAASNLFFRDVKYIVEVFLTYAIFFTPVLYDASMLGQWQSLIMLNPVAPLLEGMSDAIVHDTLPDTAWLAYSLVFAVALLVGGFWAFKRSESRFAESI